MIDCLFISNLFPNPSEPGRGLYNRDQLLALSERGFKVRVLCPLPWFPGINPWKKDIPYEDRIDGIPITYCRQFYLPGSRGAQNAVLYSLSVRRLAARLIREHQPRFLWASFAFPDGVGVACEARRHGLPYVVSLLGSDINLNREHSARWQEIISALRGAKVILAKSAALRDVVRNSESDSSFPPICLDYNGIDQTLFHPADRAAMCRRLGVDPATKRILFVGNLVPVKDVQTLLKAFAEIATEGKGQGACLRAEASARQASGPSSRGSFGVASERHVALTDGGRCPRMTQIDTDENKTDFVSSGSVHLVCIGSGPEESRLRRLAGELGIADQVRWEGRQPREVVATWMQASDCLCLPSLHEGIPNVVLESLACGCPVAATRVGGIPEIHPGEAAGGLFEPGDGRGLARMLDGILKTIWDRDALRRSIQNFTWERNAKTLLQAFGEWLGKLPADDRPACFLKGSRRVGVTDNLNTKIAKG